MKLSSVNFVLILEIKKTSNKSVIETNSAFWLNESGYENENRTQKFYGSETWKSSYRRGLESGARFYNTCTIKAISAPITQDFICIFNLNCIYMYVLIMRFIYLFLKLLLLIDTHITSYSINILHLYVLSSRLWLNLLYKRAVVFVIVW